MILLLFHYVTCIYGGLLILCVSNCTVDDVFGRKRSRRGRRRRIPLGAKGKQVTPSKTSDTVEYPLHWRLMFRNGALEVDFINSGGRWCGFVWILGRRSLVDSSRQYAKASTKISKVCNRPISGWEGEQAKNDAIDR
jgi:hypothetical protein